MRGKHGLYCSRILWAIGEFEPSPQMPWEDIYSRADIASFQEIHACLSFTISAFPYLQSEKTLPHDRNCRNFARRVSLADSSKPGFTATDLCREIGSVAGELGSGWGGKEER